jgi:hypothetical protein
MFTIIFRVLGVLRRCTWAADVERVVRLHLSDEFDGARPKERTLARLILALSRHHLCRCRHRRPRHRRCLHWILSMKSPLFQKYRTESGPLRTPRLTQLSLPMLQTSLWRQNSSLLVCFDYPPPVWPS